jgi:uncharacterized protein (TIGR02186 family)
MFTKFIIKAAVMFSAAAGIGILFSGGSAWALTTEVTPQNIPINLLYHGAQVSLKGESDVNDDLIVRISSEPTEAHMKYKGKAAGLFWMKMGDMSFEHVPSLYLLYSSRALDSLLQEDEQIKEGIGFESIKADTKVESSIAEMDEDRWIGEFIKFKEAEKLYQIQEGAITRRHGTQGNEYQLDISWPFQAPPGTYTIEVLAVRDGNLVNRTETSLTVARTGIVGKLSDLAFNHAAAYGIISVIVAMAAGFAVGALFKKGGRAH